MQYKTFLQWGNKGIKHLEVRELRQDQMGKPTGLVVAAMQIGVNFVQNVAQLSKGRLQLINVINVAGNQTTRKSHQSFAQSVAILLMSKIGFRKGESGGFN